MAEGRTRRSAHRTHVPSLPPLHFLGRRRLYRVRAAANEEAEVTAAPQSPAAATRLKPEWIALLEKLVPHFSGITESSGEAESGVKKPAMHLGADAHPAAQPPAWAGEGRGSGEGVRAAEEALAHAPREALKPGPPQLCPHLSPGAQGVARVLLGSGWRAVKGEAPWLFWRVHAGGSRKWLGDLRTSPCSPFS